MPTWTTSVKYFEDVYQGVNDSKDYNSSLKVKVVDC